MTKRAARAATTAALLGASHGALRSERTRLGKQSCWCTIGGKPKRFLLRQALSGGGDVPGWLCPPVWGRARKCAPQRLARGHCL